MCINKKCSATIHTNEKISIIHRVRVKRNNHGAKKKIVLKSSQSTSYESPKDLEFGKTSTNIAVQTVHHNMLMENSAKEKPERVTEGLCESLYVKIPTSEEVLQINHNGNNTVCFTTISNLELLCDSESILIDSTYPGCSQFFHQLLTIYCSVTHQPLAHFLLPDNCPFNEIFEKLWEHCRYLGMKFEPNFIKSNLDSDYMNFMKTLNPLCSLYREKSGATESWWQKVKDLHLIDEFSDRNSSLAKWLRWTFPMLILNQPDVADSFLKDLKSQTADMEIANLYSYYLTDSDASSKNKRDMNPNTSNVITNYDINGSYKLRE